MRLLVLLFCFFPMLAFADDEPHKPVWVLVGPETYRSSLFRNNDWSLRPELEMHIGLSNRLLIVGSLTYYEFDFRGGILSRLNFGPGIAYDLIPERLRLTARFYMANSDFLKFEGESSIGTGLRAQYFVPVGHPWRLFFSLGWDLVQEVNLRHDTTPGAVNGRCILFCFLPKQEEKNHIYQYEKIPGSHEFSSGIGAAYSFY